MLTDQDMLSSAQALWAQFKPDPAVVDLESWTMSKLGSPISPLEVVLNGSQSMHAVDDEGIWVQGLGLQRSWEQLQIRRATSHVTDHPIALSSPEALCLLKPCLCIVAPSCAAAERAWHSLSEC